MRHGFDLGYITWVHHGEPALPPPPLVIDNTRQPQMSDMTALLNDLSYILPNNEHNKPTQGDIGETSNEMTQATRNEFEELYASANEELPRKIQHPVDGRAWKNFDTKYLDFAKESRNVRLGLAADGFNPFGNLSQAYNLWPVILTTYNLPPWLCMKESSFMLTLLIPGPKSPGKDIDVYLRPLIEDLKVLWDRKGVETIDIASGQKFNTRAMVLWTINDFPARSSLSGWSGQGYKACPTCNEDTPSVRVLSKTAYVGHRRFLKKPYKWRSSREFNGQTDNRDPPKEFGRDKILAQLDRLPTRLTGKHLSYGGVKIKRNVLVELNWTKRGWTTGGATCRWGKVCHRGTNCLTEKRVGPTSSLGIVSLTRIPQRHFDGDRFPERHVAGESPEMLLGKTPIVVSGNMFQGNVLPLIYRSYVTLYHIMVVHVLKINVGVER
ncbi:hypothetical protein Tco_0378651 [Tanacetum coccineum]